MLIGARLLNRIKKQTYIYKYIYRKITTLLFILINNNKQEKTNIFKYKIFKYTGITPLFLSFFLYLDLTYVSFLLIIFCIHHL